MGSLRKILKTPWTLLLPLAGICALSMVYYLGFSSQRLAASFALEMEKVEEDQVEPIARKIGNLGKAGVPVLVQGLGSPRRVVVLSSRDTLETQFLTWSQWESERSSPFNLVFARSLAENLDRFGPASRMHAASFARRIMRTMLLAPEQKYPRQSEIAQYCDQILQSTEGENFVKRSPRRLNDMHTVVRAGEPNRTFSPDPGEVELMIAANQKRNSSSVLPVRSQEDPGGEYFDPYSGPRAETLYAIYEARKNRIQNAPSMEDRLDSLPLPGNTEQLAESPGERGEEVPDAILAAPNARIASQFQGDSFQEVPEEQRLPQLPRYQDSSSAVIALNSDRPGALPPVEKTPLGFVEQDRIKNLDTAELMRLLQHPQISFQAIAEQQLRKRDHFQDAHISLARKLYHPDTEIRIELVEQLPKTPRIDPTLWFAELLKDPDPEVRLAVISCIATSQNTNLVRRMIQHAKNDEDPRVHGILDKLQRLQKSGLTIW